MRKKPTFLSLCISLCCLSMVTAQEMPGSSKERVDNAVLGRVAEIAMITNMPAGRQAVLARYYMRRDSLMQHALQTKLDTAGQRLLMGMLTEEFDNCLTSYERSRYYAAIHKNYIQWEAAEAAAHLGNKYNCRPEIREAIYKIDQEKNQDLDKVFVTKGDAGVGTLTGHIFDRYDSLSAIYEIAAAGETYLEKNIKILEAIRPLEEKEKTVLRRTFLNACLRHGNNYYNNFHIALQFTTNRKEYYDLLYKDSIEQEVLSKSKKDLRDITTRYGLTESMSRKFSDIVMDKNRVELDLQLRMPYSIKRDSLQRENDEQHWAAIKEILIRNGYYRLSNSRFVYAMRYEKALGLSAEEMDSLAGKNYQLDMMTYRYSLLDPWKDFDATAFTNFQLERILRPGQYDTLLIIESKPRALANTNRDWEALKTNGIVAAEDSAAVFNELLVYHLDCETITRRYAHNSTARQKQMNQARERKPQALKKLEAQIKINEYDTANVK